VSSRTGHQLRAADRRLLRPVPAATDGGAPATATQSTRHPGAGVCRRGALFARRLPSRSWPV